MNDLSASAGTRGKVQQGGCRTDGCAEQCKTDADNNRKVKECDRKVGTDQNDSDTDYLYPCR